MDGGNENSKISAAKIGSKPNIKIKKSVVKTR
jgi:hypothetical protein